MMKMNRHTKIAFVVAPLLAVFGWIGGEIWQESQAMKKRLFELKPEAGFCDVMGKKCILYSGDFQLSIYQEQNKTVVNSTFPLDTATLFLVDGENNSQSFRLGMQDSPYYWHQVTNFAELNGNSGSKQKLRVIVTVKGGQYFGEFMSTTL